MNGMLLIAAEINKGDEIEADGVHLIGICPASANCATSIVVWLTTIQALTDPLGGN